MPRRNNKNSYTSKRFLQCASFISFLKSAIFVPKSSLENMFLQPPNTQKCHVCQRKKCWTYVFVEEKSRWLRCWWTGRDDGWSKKPIKTKRPWIFLILDPPLNFQQIWGANYYWKAFCSQKLECCFKRICTSVPASEKIPRCHSLKFYSMLKI